MNLAIREGNDTPDDSLPEPSDVPFTPDELDFIYEFWTVWCADGKKHLPSELIREFQLGYGWILTGLNYMESLYDKTKMQLNNQKPKPDNYGRK